VSVTFSGFYSANGGKVSLKVEVAVTPVDGETTTITTNSGGDLPDTEIAGTMFNLVETVYAPWDSSVVVETVLKSVRVVDGSTVDLSRDVSIPDYVSTWAHSS
jgi:hypothetical protein